MTSRSAAILILVASTAQADRRRPTEPAPEHVDLTFSVKPYGAPKTEFACGEYVYANVTFTGIHSNKVELRWRLDGKPVTRPPDLPITDSQSYSLVGPGNSGQTAFAILPDPADIPNPEEADALYYKAVVALPAGDHAIQIIVGDPATPQGTAALTLKCAGGMAPYRKPYDKLRGTTLGSVTWDPSPARLKHWDATARALVSFPDDDSARLVAVASLVEHVDNDSAQRPHERIVQGVAAFRMADGTCEEVSTMLLQEFDLDRRVWSAMRVVMSQGDRREIACAALPGKGR